MVPVFTREAWIKYWQMMESDRNFWGWGYTGIAKSFCKYHNMGIIDCESVRHTRLNESHNTKAWEEMHKFLVQKRSYPLARHIVYGKLR
jgi:hypothetical protein